MKHSSTIIDTLYDWNSIFRTVIRAVSRQEGRLPVKLVIAACGGSYVDAINSVGANLSRKTIAQLVLVWVQRSTKSLDRRTKLGHTILQWQTTLDAGAVW